MWHGHIVVVVVVVRSTANWQAAATSVVAAKLNRTSVMPLLVTAPSSCRLSTGHDLNHKLAWRFLL